MPIVPPCRSRRFSRCEGLPDKPITYVARVAIDNEGDYMVPTCDNRLDLRATADLKALVCWASET